MAKNLYELYLDAHPEEKVWADRAMLTTNYAERKRCWAEQEKIRLAKGAYTHQMWEGLEVPGPDGTPPQAPPPSPTREQLYQEFSNVSPRTAEKWAKALKNRPGESQD
jgi:hypothetical protein